MDNNVKLNNLCTNIHQRFIFTDKYEKDKQEWKLQEKTIHEMISNNDSRVKEAVILTQNLGGVTELQHLRHRIKHHVRLGDM